MQTSEGSEPTYTGAYAVLAAIVLWFAVVVAAYLSKQTDLGVRLGLAGSFIAVLVACLFVRQYRIARRSRFEADRTTRALQMVQARFETLLRHAADVVLIITPSGICVYISPTASSMLGVDADLAVGRPLEVLLGSGAPKVMEQVRSVAGLPGLVTTTDFQLTQPNGSVKFIEVRLANLVHNLSVGGIVLNLADVTERKQNEQLLQHQAGSDALTGLLNRSRLDEVLKVQWSDHVRRRATFAVLFADLDGFKSVNDRFGHEAGDEVLREVSQRLIEAVRGHDVVVRFGGDEFVVVCPNTDLAESETVSFRIQESVSRPILVANGVAQVGISLGIALGPAAFADIDALMRYADENMYRIKGSKPERARKY